MNWNEKSKLDRRDFMKTAALGAVTVSAAATGLIGATNEAQAAPTGAPKSGAPMAMESFKHKQSFSVITMGTNSPAPNLKRASACTMIQCNGKYYVLDTGNGSYLNFTRGNYRVSDIEAIMFTHLHMDHTSDYMEVLVNRWMEGAKELDLIGPPRTGEMHELLTTFFADDLTYRMLRGQSRGISESGLTSDVNVKELIGANNFDLDGMKVTTAELTHTMYNLGYRFDFNGQSIVVSGDTSFDEKLIVLAKDADILVMDAGSMTPKKEMTDTSETDAFDDTSKKIKPRYEYAGNFDVQPHVDIDDIITISTKANVKKLVFTHIPPFGFEEEKVMGWMRDGGYKGEVIFGSDTLEINT
jgi:ribonuclease BN (tRNA processing enzyme)